MCVCVCVCMCMCVCVYVILFRRVKGAERLPGVDEILLPGERGNRLAASRRAAGTIEIEPNMYAALKVRYHTHTHTHTHTHMRAHRHMRAHNYTGQWQYEACLSDVRARVSMCACVCMCVQAMAAKYGQPASPSKPPHARLSIATQLVHSHTTVEDPYGGSGAPLWQTATFAQPSATTFGPYDYTRSGNPTRTMLEEQVAALEGADKAFAFTSGMAAIAAVGVTHRRTRTPSHTHRNPHRRAHARTQTGCGMGTNRQGSAVDGVCDRACVCVCVV